MLSGFTVTRTSQVLFGTKFRRSQKKKMTMKKKNVMIIVMKMMTFCRNSRRTNKNKIVNK